MEVKINNNGEMLDATIEMVDGVMVVSPKVVKFEPKDGDVFCVDSFYPIVGIVKEVYSYGKPDKDRLYFSVGYWKQSGNMQFGIFCACNRNTEPNYRPATEEEKKKLLLDLKGKEDVTLDGHEIMLYANIGNVKKEHIYGKAWFIVSPLSVYVGNAATPSLSPSAS